MRTVAERIKGIIAEQLNIAEEKVTEGAHIADDLGADSLDHVELIMAIEEEFIGDIPDEVAVKLLTVSEIIKYVEGKIGEAKKNHFGEWRE